MWKKSGISNLACNIGDEVMVLNSSLRWSLEQKFLLATL